jgi:hypothetical protein
MRAAIRETNKRMKRDGSNWTLKIKYRKPKPGRRYAPGGDVTQEDALFFALYLKERPKTKAEREQERAQKMTARIEQEKVNRQVFFQARAQK